MSNIAFIKGEDKNISGKTITVKCQICDRTYIVASGAAVPMCHDKFMKEILVEEMIAQVKQELTVDQIKDVVKKCSYGGKPVTMEMKGGGNFG